MRFLVKKLILIPFTLVITFSCSTKKDRFANRAYRYTVLKYNVIFNGTESIKNYEKKATSEYYDNYFHILPIYPIDLETKDTDSTLARAEKKALKGIHRHSMNIGKKERNRYIDRAYLLLGKALFYQKEYDAAVETFSYAKSHLEGFKEWNHNLVWLERSNIMQKRYSGYNSLKKELNNKDLRKEEKREILKVLVELSIKSENYNSANEDIDNLIKITKNKKERHRYLFIKGQLQRSLGNKEESIKILKRIISEKPKKKLEAISYVYIASYSDESIEKLSPLFKIINDKKYDEVKNIVLYEIADVYYKNNMIDSCIFYAKKSIETSNNRKTFNIETGYSYDLIEKAYFENADYLNAINSCNKGIKRLNENIELDRDIIERLQKQRRNLSTITAQIKSYKKRDSIIKINSIPKDTLRKKYYSEIKKRKDLVREKKEKKKEEFKSEDNWYFYNRKLILSGKKEFDEIWEKRDLVDNWRFLKKEINKIENTEEDRLSKNEDSLINIEVEEKISNIYIDNNALLETKEKRNYDYYSVAILYRDQFDRYDLCIKQLKKLLTYKIKDDLKVPSYYFMYKSYMDLNNIDSANIYKEIILNNYKDSKYALILSKDNDDSNKKIKGTSEELYTEIYRFYRKQDTSMVDTLIYQFENTYPNDNLMPKVGMIKAMRFSKNDYKRYIKELKYVMFNHPGTLEADEAEKLISKAEVFIEKNKKLRKVGVIPHYVIIKSDDERYNKSLEKIKEFFPNTESSMTEVEKNKFILIKEFKNKDEAKVNTIIFLRKIGKLYKKNDIFVISYLDYMRLLDNNKISEFLKK